MWREIGKDHGCNWGRDVPLKSAQMIEPQTGPPGKGEQNNSKCSNREVIFG